MKFDQLTLLQQLQNDVQGITSAIKQIATQHSDMLNHPPVVNTWSILQVVEHLNTYNDYYLPAINIQLDSCHAAKQSGIVFTPGILGNYFVNMMQPQNGAIKARYKAAKRHIPQVNYSSEDVLRKFFKDQKALVSLLNKAEKYKLDKVSVSISLTKLIRINAGDALRFLVAHQQRHLLQIERCVRVSE